MSEKQEPGTLGKLAAIATALTAILGLVFLLFPQLKPADPKSSQQARHDAPRLDDRGAAQPDATTPSQALDADGARVIRGVLTAHQAGEAEIQSAFKPLDRDPPGPSARPAEQAAYLMALQESFQNAERVSRARLTDLEGVRLAATPAPFREAVQAHVAAWRDCVQVFSQASILAARAALDVRSRGATAYEELFPNLTQVGARAADVDHAISRTWADVKAAALAVGIE